jgi:hypothetical protein
VIEILKKVVWVQQERKIIVFCQSNKQSSTLTLFAELLQGPVQTTSPLHAWHCFVPQMPIATQKIKQNKK